MNRNHRTLAWCGVCCAVWGLAAEFAHSEDWPTYRGPRRNCISTETGLLDAWPEGGPTQRWEVQLEPGNSSPIVTQGRVLCLGRKNERGWNHSSPNKPEGPVILYCVDRTNGTLLWKHEMPVFIETDNSAMNTPAVDGDRVYARGGNGDVHCVSIKDGSLLWRWPREDEQLKKRGGYRGTTFAPDVLITDDLAIFCDQGAGYNCGQKLMAANKTTGEIVWQYKRSMAPAYDTLKPELVTVDDKRYLLLDHFALEIATGKEVCNWGDKALTEVNITATTRGGETGYISYANAVLGNTVYMNFCRASTQAAPQEGTSKDAATPAKGPKPEHGLLAMRFEHDKSGTLVAHKQWEWIGDRGSWVNSPVVGGGALVMNLGKDGTDLVCLDSASGKECWKYRISRLPGVHQLYSEPLFADGKFFLSANDLVMIAADATSFRLLGRASLKGSSNLSSGGGGSYHAPALSDGCLFARNNQGTLFCFDIRKDAGSTADGSARK